MIYMNKLRYMQVKKKVAGGGCYFPQSGREKAIQRSQSVMK